MLSGGSRARRLPLFPFFCLQPPPDEFFYIPQKPYNVWGTLFDQLTYPETAAKVRSQPAPPAATRCDRYGLSH